MCYVYGMTAKHKDIKNVKGKNKMKFQVIDSQTKYLVGTYATLRRALSKADKLDLAYGAVRYIVKPIQA